ncbi:MAG: hypothetical protein E7Z70_05980 [Thermoplasmata archaeon]|nr:hypothetical protein [Thermoplasmata archaeon]
MASDDMTVHMSVLFRRSLMDLSDTVGMSLLRISTMVMSPRGKALWKRSDITNGVTNRRGDS